MRWGGSYTYSRVRVQILHCPVCGAQYRHYNITKRELLREAKEEPELMICRRCGARLEWAGARWERV